MGLKRIATILGLVITLACSGPESPTNDDLETLYIRLVEIGRPGLDPDPAELESLRLQIDSLGGRAAVESLLVNSMTGDPVSWSALLDSLAESIR